MKYNKFGYPRSDMSWLDGFLSLLSDVKGLTKEG